MTPLKQLLELAELESYSFNQNIRNTFHENITFDEIPLISRLEHLKLLTENTGFSSNDLNSFLLNTAIFYLNHLKLRAQQELTETEFKKYLLCLTYPDFEDNAPFEKVYIPNLCITQKKFLNKDFSKLKFEQAPWFFQALKALNLESKVIFQYSLSKDQYGSYKRLYVFL